MWNVSIILSLVIIALMTIQGFALESRPESDGVPQYSIKGVSAVLDSTLLDSQWPKGNRRAHRYNPKCDITARQGICLNNGRHLILPDASVAGTIGSYSFDENIHGVLIDASGNGNHGIAGPKAESSLISAEETMLSTNTLSRKVKTQKDSGVSADNNPLFSPTIPTVIGRIGGFAAQFNGQLYYKIPSSPSLQELKGGFTISFWFYLAAEKIESNAPTGCPIFSIGGNNMYITSDRYFSFALPEYGVLASHARVRVGHWTHVTLSYDPLDKQFTLFVNGIPDVHANTVVRFVDEVDAYIGAEPASQCSYVNYYVDDVKITSVISNAATIAAQAFSSLGTVESSFVHLACSRQQPCGFEEARHRCNVNHHICSKTELAAGGYSVARIQGWLNYADSLWTADDIIQFKHVYELQPRVDINAQVSNLDKDILQSLRQRTDFLSQDTKNTAQFDVEEVVLGERSAKYQARQALLKALVSEREAMSHKRLALCCSS